ncbi:hypothetical protein KSZ_13040 [Dictyobacter formicarum]|uniref:Resolvase HTH domain-containing protein n=1 Tax=Dictyobacter formicarum TaxID=2778368 RepID=A0ABQ3VD22_9CHLR|nr:hypothetical protein KSZ_13040 [Dictyobacter formicarum]
MPPIEQQAGLAEEYGIDTLLYCRDFWALRRRILNKDVVEYKETSGLFAITHWCERNRRALNHQSHLALIPIDQLFSGCGNIFISAKAVCEQAIEKPALISSSQYNLEPAEPKRKIPVSEWPSIFRRIVENQEPLRKVAGDYGVSYETVRRIVQMMNPRGKEVSKQ